MSTIEAFRHGNATLTDFLRDIEAIEQFEAERVEDRAGADVSE